MPNWCYNHLVVRGPDAAIEEFTAGVEPPIDASADNDDPDGDAADDSADDADDETLSDANGALSLAILLPPPKDAYADTLTLLDWRITHWGTKWDIGSCRIAIDVGMRNYAFDSAEGAPTEWLITVIPRFPALSGALHYAEPNCVYGGTLTFRDGRVSSHRHLTTISGVRAKLSRLTELWWEADRYGRAMLRIAALGTPEYEWLRVCLRDQGVRTSHSRGDIAVKASQAVRDTLARLQLPLAL